ncbi:hypothetical protein [Methanoregula sp.]|uniref:hypothetical protein n=1 Tax=Methanoregula sp. TaxID=2052170 RepID=UPI003C71B6DC
MPSEKEKNYLQFFGVITHSGRLYSARKKNIPVFLHHYPGEHYCAITRYIGGYARIGIK